MKKASWPKSTCGRTHPLNTWTQTAIPEGKRGPRQLSFHSHAEEIAREGVYRKVLCAGLRLPRPLTSSRAVTDPKAHWVGGRAGHLPNTLSRLTQHGTWSKLITLSQLWFLEHTTEPLFQYCNSHRRWAVVETMVGTRHGGEATNPRLARHDGWGQDGTERYTLARFPE